MTPERRLHIERWYMHKLFEGTSYVAIESIDYFLCERPPSQYNSVTCEVHEAGFCGWCWKCDMPLCGCNCNVGETRDIMKARAYETHEG